MILLPIFFIGCENQIQQKNSKSSIPNNLITNWVTGIEYVYVKNPEVHAACKMENTTCITYQEYEQACKLAAGASKGASGSAALLGGVDYLFRNGSIDTLEVIWSSNYSEFPCRLIISVSGIVNGNSKKQTISPPIEGYIINSDGKLLAHRTGF